jgi:MFS-type transporter involved in bile tolerance (Atg22 family)
LPKSLAFIYGAFVDTISLGGMRKRYWMVLAGLCQFILLFFTSMVVPDDYHTTTVLLACSNIALSFMDVVSNGLMVMQAKRKPYVGAQDLQSF